MAFQLIRDERYEAGFVEAEEFTECGKCLCYIYPDDEYTVMADGRKCCSDCREMCAGGCGDWLTDKIVNLRCHITGKPESFCVPDASENVLRMLIEYTADHSCDPVRAGMIWKLDADRLTQWDISGLYALYTRAL